MLFFLWYYKWTKTLPGRYCYKYLISNGSFGSATAKQVDTDHLHFRNEKPRKRTAQQLVIYHSVLREVHILSTGLGSRTRALCHCMVLQNPYYLPVFTFITMVSFGFLNILFSVTFSCFHIPS